MSGPENIWSNTRILRKPRSIRRKAFPLRLTCDDACPDAVLPDNIYRECGSCQLFRLHSESLLGVCGHPAHRRKETTEEETL